MAEAKGRRAWSGGRGSARVHASSEAKPTVPFTNLHDGPGRRDDDASTLNSARDDAESLWSGDERVAGRAFQGRVVVDSSAHNAEEYSLGHVLKAGDDPYYYEGLGDGDDDVPWTMPSVAKAKLFRRVMTFGKGRASVRHTGMVEWMALGPANANYFLMLKYFGLGLLLMTVFAVFPLHLAHTGNGVIRLDDMNIARVTLGNAGIRPVVPFNDSHLLFPDSGGVPVQKPSRNSSSFLGFEFDEQQTGKVLAQADIVNTLVFLGIIIAFRVKNRIISRRSNESTVLTSAYSVMVTGLPADATEGEVRRHFSDLFQLADPDWETSGLCCGLCCRKKARLPQDLEDSGDTPGDKDVIEQMDPIDPCHPVTDVSNTQDDRYLGSWVAEVSLVHKDSAAVRAYLSRLTLDKKLRTVRAIAKKYSVDTPLKSGPNARKKLAAMKKVGKLSAKKAYFRSKQGGASSHTVGAFVTFNNEESALRCVEDYKRWHGLLSRRFQPLSLRFRGQHVLLVERAPEPEEVLWENLETTGFARFVRGVFLGWGAMLLLMLLAFFIVYQTMRLRGVQGEPDVIPSAAVCEDHLPATWYEQYLTIEDPQIVRASSAYPFCADPQASLYLVYQVPDVASFVHLPSELRAADIERPLPDINVRVTEIDELSNANVLLAHVEESRITNVTNITLPLPTNPCFGPCINLNDLTIPDPDPDDNVPAPTLCEPFSCTDEGSGYTALGHPCTPAAFKPGILVDCYCQQQLQHAIKADGLLSAVFDLRGGPDGDICTSYAAKFWWNETLPYIGAVLLVLLNRVIQIVAVRMSYVERFASHKHRRLAVMIKVFVTQFVCMAVIIPLVSFTPGDGNLWSSLLPMKEGQWTQFESDWYSVNGYYLALVMLFNATVIHMIDLLHWIAVKPLQRSCCTRSTPNQMGLNMLHKGPEFDVSVRYGAVLAHMFTVAVYYSALPIMLPVGAALLGILYWVDKLLFLRFYTKPSFMPSLMTDTVNLLMPWAVFVHLITAVYVFSAPVTNTGTFDFSTLFLASDAEDSAAKVADWSSQLSSLPFNLSAHMFKADVFPLLLLAILYFVGLIVAQTLSKPILKVVRKCLEFTSCGLICKASAVNPDRRFVPPYTQQFVRELNPRDEYELLPEEVLDGWVLETDARSVQTLSKVWLADGVVAGVDHVKGARKRTWEVLRDESLHSYVISANPRYKNALSESAPALTMSRAMKAPPRTTRLQIGDSEVTVSPQAV